MFAALASPAPREQTPFASYSHWSSTVRLAGTVAGGGTWGAVDNLLKYRALSVQRQRASLPVRERDAAFVAQQ
jgi:hypothetical protein